MRSILAKILAFAATVLFCLLAMQSAVEASMVSLNDEQLSQVDGQALIEMQKVTQNGFTFYTVGLDATLNLNANIQKLRLGCDGINGVGGCDISADNLSFGCGSANGTSCYTPASSCSPLNGVTAPCTGSTGTVSSLLPFVMQNPFIQFAIQNDGTPATRQVSGFRLGASSVSGPLSIGNFNTFSGYLTATANMTLQAQNDVGVTCGPGHTCLGTAESTNCGGHGCTGGTTTNGINFKNYPQPLQALGLNDDYACATVLITLCAAFDSLTVNLPTASATNLPVVLSGNRQTQGLVYNANLGDVVHSDVVGMTINQSNGLPSWLINAIIGLIQNSAELAFDNQLAGDLGLPGSTNLATVRATLNAYIMPYNIANLHQQNITTNTFGLSLQNQAVQYPGYTAAVPRGWAMNMTNAFTMSVASPTSIFMNNMASGAARVGNIIGLPGPTTNCYGGTTFC